MDKKAIAEKIEHTALKPTVTRLDIEILCREALQWNFFGVCVNPVWIENAVQVLKNSPIKIISVAGFPLGASATEIKCREIEYALGKGAAEVDFVLNIGWLKGRGWDLIKNEFDQVVRAASGKPLKVILETCLLSDEEKKQVCEMAVD